MVICDTGQGKMTHVASRTLGNVSGAGTVTSRAGTWLQIVTIAVCFCLCGHFGAHASAQTYNAIIVFGDSLSDVGNDAVLSSMKYTVAGQVPGPATGYTNGRFTDGTDTTPPAVNYNGIWVEQLAAKLAAHPTVVASLNGGTDYAYGYATINTGTSQLTYGPANLSITVNNMATQVASYLATHPTINSNTLFVVWGGANDLLAATTSTDISNAVKQELGLVQQLIAAGATDILVPNLPPLGLIPRLNQNATASQAATAAAQAFNQGLAVGLAQLPTANPGKTLRLFPLDVYTLFNTIVGPPIASGFKNVTSASSVFFGASNAALNPDTYLFWDDLHPTTFGHNQIAAAALSVLGTPVQTTLNLSASTVSANLNSTVQFTASVAGSSGSTPVGTVTFYDGSTQLGSSLVSASGSNGTATYSTSTLAAGTHTISATFTGVNGFANSTSANLVVTVTAPGFVASASPTSLTISRGSTGTSTVTVSSVGGYSGSFTVACANVPAKIACTVGTGTVSITGTSSATSVVTINTNNVADNVRPSAMGSRRSGITLAFVLLPLGALLPWRRRHAMPHLLHTMLFLLSLCGLAGLNGCAGDPLAHDTPAGSYQVPVVVTPSSGTATTLTLTVTVQ